MMEWYCHGIKCLEKVDSIWLLNLSKSRIMWWLVVTTQASNMIELQKKYLHLDAQGGAIEACSSWIIQVSTNQFNLKKFSFSSPIFCLTIEQHYWLKMGGRARTSNVSGRTHHHYQTPTQRAHVILTAPLLPVRTQILCVLTTVSVRHFLDPGNPGVLRLGKNHIKYYEIPQLYYI